MRFLFMHTDVFLRSVLIGVTCIEETAEREGLLIGDWTLFICVYILLDILRLSLVSEQTIFELSDNTRACGRSTETKPCLM